MKIKCTICRLPKKTRSDSISSIGSFTFVSQKSKASSVSRNNNDDSVAHGTTQRQIESKYKLLSSTDSPPVIRGAIQLFRILHG